MRLLLSSIACLIPVICWAGPVDINTADAPTLAKELKGIGPAKAQAIVAWRKEHGPFKSPDDLSLVKGIAQKVIDENRPNIRIESGTRTAAPAAPKPAG
jgi:competence protein ComEA